ncbi:transforming growth factor-beta-induced protein ig-h3-like isoform X2 [Palaemon carinicauda]|uniref:transforming growth factor-beta-induced protein ig-h3-like isoform X2 n=1 Tax=Palaemon carinicauda TaxID=392227 RepID=UPI0035B670BE
MVGLIILTLYMATPPTRSQLAMDARIYQLSPNGGYRLNDNPSHVYVPGRDVCMIEEVPALNLTFPLPWTHGTFCNHKTYLHRQCCEGFGAAALEFGCPVVEKVVDIMTAMRNTPRVKKFVEWMEFHYMERRHLGRLFEDPPDALTLLVPLDEGFRWADNFTTSELGRVAEIHRGHTSPLLLYHMLPRRWYVHQLYQNQQLKTLYQDTTVTVTKLSNTMVLFNCVPVHRVDIHARDGVMHVLQRPVPPSYVMSLVDLISMDPDLTMFFTILGYADLLDWIRSVDSITVLAPTNAAFKRLPLRFLDSITYDVKYFPALQAMSLVQVTRRAGATKFIELVKQVGLFDDLVSFGPYTVFAPSNRAFRRLNESFFNDKAALRNLVMYHLVEGSHASFTLLDNQALPTLLPDTFLRVKVHVRVMSAEDGVVTSGDHIAFNGYVHVVDRVLHPPVYSIARVLARNPKLRRFTSLITQSGIALWRELSLEKGPYTLFAVLDDEMDRWAADLFTYYRIINDEKLLNRSLSAHILDDFVMPRALEEGSHSILRPRLRRPSPHRYPLRLTASEGRLSLRHASVSKNFILCTNGIILFIDTMLLP